MHNRITIKRSTILAAMVLLVAIPAFSQTALAQSIEGRWIMEDIYTVHVDDGAVSRIESHAPAAFVTEVVFNADGTGRQGDQPFRWIQNQDEIQWRFDEGGTVSLLVRFLTPDYFLVFARSPGRLDLGAAVSGLVRVR